jgi:anti-sigma factor RsiW
MGADCSAGKAAKADDLAKSADVAALQKAVDELKEKVKKYESQPVPHVMLRAVTKQVAGDPATKAATLADIPMYPELTKADHVYNGDGSVDYVTSYAQKRLKLAAAAAA